MSELQDQNSIASWKNFLVGFCVVMFVVFASLAYFNNLTANALKPSPSAKDVKTTKEKISPNVKGSTSQKNSQLQDKAVYTTVLEGEGLWNVAERVCKNGEKFVKLAEANKLGIDASVETGQRLLIKCD